MRKTNAEAIPCLYSEVCGGAARIQLHLSLFTCRHRLVEFRKNCSKTERNWETVNKPFCSSCQSERLSEVTPWKKKPLIIQPCCDEVSWQHTRSWMATCMICEAEALGGGVRAQPGTWWCEERCRLQVPARREQSRARELCDGPPFPFLFIWHQRSSGIVFNLTTRGQHIIAKACQRHKL